jgi:hypothetical protein
MPTTTRGQVAVVLVGELPGERGQWAQHQFANQQGGVDMLARQFGLGESSRLLLEFEQESHVVSLAVMRLWARRFAVSVGWNISPLQDDARATARINLIRSDRMTSAGMKFPARPGT